MIRIDNTPLGCGLVPGVPRFNYILSGLVAAGVSALGGLAGASASNSYTKEQMKYSQQLQNAQQEWLANTQYGKMASGMKNAGLNPATANGTTPATPAAGHPSSSAPDLSGLGSNAVAAAINAENAAKDIEVKDAQKENIQADTQLKESQTTNTEADTVIKRWQGLPEYQKAVLDGLNGQAKKAWAEAGLADQQTVKCVAEIQKIGKEMKLTDEQINLIQAEAAKTRKEIDAIVKGMDEADARMLLMEAQRRTESAKQAELYAAADEHRASAADHRAGVVQKHADARLSGQQAKLVQIETKMKSFEQKVIEASGSPTEQGALRGAKRLVNIVNPMSSITDYFNSGSH